jgi:anti-sigma factor RsiW
VKPDDTRLLHAYLDGELDSASSLELEARMAGNPALRSACERLRDLSAAIREKTDYHAAPAALRSRLGAALPPLGKARPFSWNWLKPAAAFGVAIVAGFFIAFIFMRTDESQVLAREVVASHVRATLAGRLTDVASANQHTVKPWLSARLPFSPPVAELSAQGFELAGARVDYVGGRQAAVLVYKRREHVVSVFISPALNPAGSGALAQEGFNIERFARDGMRFWVISDLNRNELGDFAKLLAESR